VSAAGAHHWRTSTVRLFNRYQACDDPVSAEDVKPGIPSYNLREREIEAKDVKPGIRSYNLRERCIDQFTSNILDNSSLISPMLSPRELSPDETKLRYREIRMCYKKACDMAVLFYVQKGGIQFDESVKEVAPYQIPSRHPYAINRWVASNFNKPARDEFLEGRRAVLVLWPATWIIEWEVSPNVRKSREEMDAKYPPDYDRCYRDAQGVHHGVISSGIVIVEKDGREPPLLEE
jgi:hypothetical protein